MKWLISGWDSLAQFIQRRPLILALIMTLCVSAIQFSSSLLSSRPSLSRSICIGALFLIICVMIAFVAAVLARLLDITAYRKIADLRDLGLISWTYLILITGFGGLYFGLNILTTEKLFRFSYANSVNLFDYLYLSGIAISVGAGEDVPAHWITRFLIVFEALAGLWLLAMVLGFVVGSLLASQQQAREARWFVGFQKVYLDALNQLSEAINSMENLERADWEILEKDLLRTIANIVKLQYDAPPSATVSANWMQLYPGQETELEYLTLAQAFCSPGMRNEQAMRTVWGILVLREWGEKPDNMPGNGELALPVYDPENLDQMRSQLPGAPLAITSQEGYNVVSDVEEIDLSNHDEAVRNTFMNYFKQHRRELKSFASVRVGFPGGDTLGAINIQSSEPDLCGTTAYEQSIIVDMIRPFARYLAEFQVNRARIESERLNE